MILNNKKKMILGIALTAVLNTSVVFAADNNSKNVAPLNNKNIVAENSKDANKGIKSQLRASSSYDAESVSLSGPTLRIITSDGDSYFIDITANNVGKNSNNLSKAVKMVQMLLNHYGYDLDVDGKCGSSTIRAIKDFQSDHDLDNDGICGHDTWLALYENF